MITRSSLLWIVTALAALAGPVAAAQQPQPTPQPSPQPASQPPRESVTVNFSDPSRPGTLRVTLINGRITVRGANRKDVAIESQGRSSIPFGRREKPDPAASKGLRRLTPEGAPGFTVDQEANAISITAGPFGRIDYEIQVPSRTNLRLTAASGGIVVEGVEGEIEVSSANGPVTLRNVTGSVVANTVNGKLIAVMAGVTAQKAMAFTSLNGDVDVTLPSSIKANLRLRSDQGDVFTNFDLDIKPAPPATVAASPRAPAARVPAPPAAPAPPAIPGARPGRGGPRFEVNQSIYGLVNGGGVEFEIRTFHGNVYVRKGS